MRSAHCKCTYSDSMDHPSSDRCMCGARSTFLAPGSIDHLTDTPSSMDSRHRRHSSKGCRWGKCRHLDSSNLARVPGCCSPAGQRGRASIAKGRYGAVLTRPSSGRALARWRSGRGDVQSGSKQAECSKTAGGRLCSLHARGLCLCPVTSARATSGLLRSTQPTWSSTSDTSTAKLSGSRASDLMWKLRK